MNLTQNWVGRLDRSYQQIKTSLLKKLTINATEITDHSEGNPLIVLIGMFAGVAEVIHLYIDSWSREMFWGTARRYKSLIKLSKLIDYQVKARGYASANILFSLHDNLGVATTHTQDIIIPHGIVLNSINSNLSFRLMYDVVIPKGVSSAYGVVAQYDEKLNVNLGNTNGLPLQRIQISDTYVHDTMRLYTEGATLYGRYTSFAQMSNTTKGYVIEIDEDKKAWVVFGDGINGYLPGAGNAVTGNFWETSGPAGNVPPNTLQNIITPVAMPNGITLKANNPDYASGGMEFEGIEEIRNRGPRSLRSLDRAVTYQDFIDVALQVVGVGTADVNYCCGKYVDLYIVPSSKGVATQVLLNQVRQYMDCRRMITTMVDVHPAGVTRIWLKADIYLKPFVTLAAGEAVTHQALDLNFGQGVAVIDRKVSITDIIAVLEAVPEIETAEISEVKIEPYARPINNTTNTLNIEFINLPTLTVPYKYTIIYSSGTNDFKIFKAGVFVATVAPGVAWADPGVLSFKINAAAYTNNDKWEFTAFPSYPAIFPNTTVQVNDHSAPVIDVSPFVDLNTPRTIFSNITYHLTQLQSNCLPPCN